MMILNCSMTKVVEQFVYHKIKSAKDLYIVVSYLYNSMWKKVYFQWGVRVVIKYFYMDIELFGAIFCWIAAIYLWISRSIITRQYKALSVLEAGVGVMLFFDAFAWYYRGVPGAVPFLILNVTNLLTFISNALIPVFFISYAVLSAGEEKPFSEITKIIAGFSLFSMLLLVINPFFGFIYTIDPNTNLYSRGPGFALLTSVYIMQMLICIIFIYMRRKSIEKLRRVAMLGFIILPLFAAAIQIFIYGYSLSNIACIITGLLMFAQALDDNAKTMIRQEIYIRRQNDELTDMRTKIALSQIKPKFVHNILNSIYVLCDSDIDRAKEVLVHLSNYLQQSIDSINTDKLISFEKELAHTMVYLELEKTRYPNRFEVEYDTPYTDFSMPPLTIQPLVENALTHGIYKLPDGEKGKLRISTSKGNGYIKVVVWDNGVGFNTMNGLNTDTLDDGQIGIRNVNDRLRIMEDAELHVRSRAGEGTTADIIIPKKDDNK